MSKKSKEPTIDVGVLHAFHNIVLQLPKRLRSSQDVKILQAHFGDTRDFSQPLAEYRQSTMKRYLVEIRGGDANMMTHDEICHLYNFKPQRFANMLSAGRGVCSFVRDVHIITITRT